MKPTKHNINLASDAGFTLIENLVAATIAGLVVISFAALGSVSARGINSINANDKIANVMSEVNMAFGDEEIYCTSNLGGQLLSLANSVGTQVPSISFHTNTGVKRGTVIEVLKQPRPGITVSEIRLVPVAAVNTGTIVSNLEISFQKGPDANAPMVMRRIPIYATLQAGRVRKCTTSPMISMTITDRICKIKNYGYAYYDENKEACVDNTEVQWHQGNLNEATCKPGFKIAVPDEETSVDPYSICKVKGSNGIDIGSRTYSNGVVDDEPVPAFNTRLDRKTGRCEFSYAKNAATPTTQTFIKCVPQGL